MYQRPSASRTRGPEPASRTRGGRPTERHARTGLLTPPGKRSRARATRSACRLEAAVSVISALPEPACDVRGGVGDDEVGAGPHDRRRRLEEGAAAIDPAVPCGRLDRGVL